MIVFDSNMIAYAAEPKYGSLRRLIEEGEVAVSSVSRIEVLGYHKIEPEELVIFSDFFGFMKQMSISDEVLDTAVSLRQQETCPFATPSLEQLRFSTKQNSTLAIRRISKELKD